MKLIPMPQNIMMEDSKFPYSAVKFREKTEDARVNKAVAKLPYADDGAELKITISGDIGEGYSLKLDKEGIILNAKSPAGAFYGIQTLRQIFCNREIYCMYVEDEPDLQYRGLYQDITDGQIPKLETLKELVDNMAYYKLNSLQLYVEHVFEFAEYVDSLERTGYITAAELKELDDYCYENFIEFIPSIATFGHLFELLDKERYSHLREREKDNQIFWFNRMFHHTIDPLNSESFEIIKSLIDQYIPCFRSDKFNICCDETFDLKIGKHKDMDTAKLYVDFVKKIIEYVKSKGKTVMMWADILLQHPEVIDDLPEDTIFLNWDYSASPSEENILILQQLKKPQIVCSGVWAWSRLCENVEKETQNITKLVNYGHKHKVLGMLNTNWGDTGNPCVSIDLAMYGIVMGAAMSWNTKTVVDTEYDACINFLLYKNLNGVKYIRELSDIHTSIDGVKQSRDCEDTHENRIWNILAMYYSNCIIEKIFSPELPSNEVFLSAHKRCAMLMEKLSGEVWEIDGYRREILIAAEGIALIIELIAKFAHFSVTRITDAGSWLEKYRAVWLEKNKESELCEIEKMLLYLENLQ